MKVSQLKLNPRNPRIITEDALKKLSESIKRDPAFMVLRPIVTDSKGLILGGNQRLSAIKLLGMKEIPDNWVVEASDLTDEQKRRFILADNAPEGMSGIFDQMLLKEDYEILELEELGFDTLFFDSDSPPEDFKEYDEGIETEYKCPKCGYEWSGKQN